MKLTKQEKKLVKTFRKYGKHDRKKILRRMQPVFHDPRWAQSQIAKESVFDLIKEHTERLDEGHSLVSFDGTIQRWFGFIDETTNEWITLPLVRAQPELDSEKVLKGDWDSLDLSPEMTKSMMRTAQGRRELFSSEGT